MAIDVNVLTNVWTIAGVIASFLVANVALILGLYSNWKLKKRREFEKKKEY